jgi:hypothetical protein
MSHLYRGRPLIFSDILTRYSEEVRRTIGQRPVVKRKAPYPGEESQGRWAPKKARIVAGRRIKDAKYRAQNAQHNFSRRKYAKATLEEERARSAEEAAALATNRYKILYWCS